MRVDVWDTVFVRASRVAVHPHVADVARYPRWWPGLRVEPAAAGLYRMTHQAPGVWPRRHRIVVRVEKVRADKGIVFAYGGDIGGKAELFYLDEVDGITVHYLLGAEAVQGEATRLLARHRASVRAALHRLKDRCEGPRLPGAEPDPALLAHQAQVAGELQPADGRHRTDAIRGQG
jgi:uncharacterized protein YndB with AHSA1/START domain